MRQDRTPFMRVHQHNDPSGMSRSKVGRVLFSLGLSDRPLTEKEVWTIEQRALRKLRTALQADVTALKERGES